MYKTVTISFLLAIAINGCSPKANNNLPAPSGFVNDFEKLFTVSEKANLESILSDYDSKTSTQIVIVTIDTSLVSSDSFDNYTLKLLRVWGVGQKEKNNGILIGISKAYRKVRIQNGYGIEKVLSNGDTKEIIDQVLIPHFREERYYEGVLEGVEEIERRLAKVK